METYGLDGIDIDWEYPGTSLAGIGSHVNDKENYTLLLKALRESLNHMEGKSLFPWLWAATCTLLFRLI